jgi:Spy/CpxP family protein refolding chaperone
VKSPRSTQPQQDAVAGPLGDENLVALALDLAESVPLSEEAIQSVNGVLAENESRAAEPGFLWFVAAGLQQTLSDEQKEKMFELRDRDNRRGGRGFRQNGRSFRGRGSGGFGMPRFTTVDLTAEQRRQIREIQKDFGDKARDVLKGIREGDVTREEAQDQLTEIREAHREAFGEVLTEEQRAELESELEERTAERESRMESQREAMVDALDLTGEQVEALDALRKEQRETLGDWRGGFWMNDFSRGEFVEDRLEIGEGMDEELAKILNGDQLETIKIHRVLVRRSIMGPQQGNVRAGRGRASGPAGMRRGRRR